MIIKTSDNYPCLMNKKEEGFMTIVAKPNNRAFTLRADKVEQFMKKNDASKKAEERFFAHKPKKGVRTPYKEADA